MKGGEVDEKKDWRRIEEKNIIGNRNKRNEGKLMMNDEDEERIGIVNIKKMKILKVVIDRELID